MKNLVLICILFLLTFCNGKVNNEEPDKNNRISEIPSSYSKQIVFDNYSFHLYTTDSANFLTLFLKDKKLLKVNSGDGYFDTVYLSKFNNDSIPDFLLVENYEDGISLTALISQINEGFLKQDMGNFYGDSYCKESWDTLKNIRTVTLQDINKDGIDEVLYNYAYIKNKLVPISCSGIIKVNESAACYQLKI